MTSKSSIRKRAVLYKSGVHVSKAMQLTPGDLMARPRADNAARDRRGRAIRSQQKA